MCLESELELDRTFKPSKNIDKFERYDHMLTGWSLHKDRYTKYLPDPPLVVFICRDQANAKEFCRAADPVVTAAQAYGGEYPAEWDPRRASACSSSPSATRTRDASPDTRAALPPEVRVARRTATPQARGVSPALKPVLPEARL